MVVARRLVCSTVHHHRGLDSGEQGHNEPRQLATPELTWPARAGQMAANRPLAGAHRVAICGWPVKGARVAKDPRAATLDSLFAYLKARLLCWTASPTHPAAPASARLSRDCHHYRFFVRSTTLRQLFCVADPALCGRRAGMTAWSSAWTT